MKHLGLLIASVFLVTTAYAAPSNTISIPNSFTANTTIQSSQVNDNNNEIQSKYNAHSHTGLTSVGTVTSGTWNADVITTQYGGTGEDLSSIASGSILYFDGVGTMGTIPMGTASQVLTMNSGATNFSWQAGGSGAKDSISRGFECSGSTLKATVNVGAGTLYHNTTVCNVSTSTVLTLTTNADFSSGTAVTYGGGAGWDYIGVDSSGNVKLLGNCPPTCNDTSGTKDTLTPKLYAWDGTKYWRVIGAIWQSTGNVSTYDQYQTGARVSYPNPPTLSTTVSAAAWTADSCTSFIPAISQFGIFGAASFQSGSTAGTFLRPTGGTGPTLASDDTDSCFGTGSSEFAGGELSCATNTAQSIDHRNLASDSSFKMVVKGYILNIR